MLQGLLQNGRPYCILLALTEVRDGPQSFALVGLDLNKFNVFTASFRPDERDVVEYLTPYSGQGPVGQHHLDAEVRGDVVLVGEADPSCRPTGLQRLKVMNGGRLGSWGHVILFTTGEVSIRIP
jgi:hypothetical protein